MKNMEEIKQEIKEILEEGEFFQKDVSTNDLFCAIIEKMNRNLIPEDARIVEHSKRGKYTTYEVDRADCIGQWDPDTKIITIKRKDRK